MQHRTSVDWQPRRVTDGHVDARVNAQANADHDGIDVVFDAASSRVFDCPLTWLGGDFSAERWILGAGVEHGEAHGWQYAARGPIALAAAHVELAESASPAAIQAAAEDVYRRLFAVQRDLGLGYPQRIWHWLDRLTDDTADDQRYQRFCRGRAQAIDAAPGAWSTLPPATLVGAGRPGVRVHALLADTPVTPVENPRQISAYRYPRAYGVRAPAFARAGVAALGASRYLLISGTASIVGHASRHGGDTDAQIDETLSNVAAVIEAAAPYIGRREPGQLTGLKAYMRDPAEAAAIEQRLRAALPAVPIALLHAPICRPELRVEVEGLMRVD